MCATFAHADLDNFYGTFGVKIYNYPGDLGDYGIEVDYSPTWTFGLGYKFRPLNVYTAIDFNAMTLSSYSENSQRYETYDLRVPPIGTSHSAPKAQVNGKLIKLY